jgi:hypothetical protein
MGKPSGSKSKLIGLPFLVTDPTASRSGHPSPIWSRSIALTGRRLYHGPLIEFSEYEHGVWSACGLPPGFSLPSFDEDYLGFGFAIERDTQNDTFELSEVL